MPNVQACTVATYAMQIAHANNTITSLHGVLRILFIWVLDVDNNY